VFDTQARRGVLHGADVSGRSRDLPPAFYWDLCRAQPGGPGKEAGMFSNCESIYGCVRGGKQVLSVRPDTRR